LIRPDEWYSKVSFLRQWHEVNEKNQYTRIKSYRVEEFKSKIKPYFLRREKREVLKDLPPFQRNFRIVDIDDVNVKRLYNRELDLMSNFMNSQKNDDFDGLTLLAYLNKLRRIVGLAKVPACLDDTLEFLDFADAESGDKITIGVHHKAVAQALALAFRSRNYKVITLSGEDSPEAKYEKQEQFKNDPECHILIASVLAAGTGLNLQFCSISSLLERQWNAAKEEQFEGRFDRFGQTRPTSCDYFVAKGTVDEYFSKMVEEKRKDCKDVLGDQLDIETNIDLMKELARQTIENRL
jgi:SWI/SNF-related matrix-associated actin-dependent regulator 1 of chromatin subfamily A